MREINKSLVSHDLASAGAKSVGDDVFQCEDQQGNGCGRLFDGNIVSNNGGLCPDCAADVATNEGC